MKRNVFAGLFVIVGMLSSIGTALAFDVNAGPIWSNADAQTKCPTVCTKLAWNGQWTTTVPGRQSVCGCNPPPVN